MCAQSFGLLSWEVLDGDYYRNQLARCSNSACTDPSNEAFDHHGLFPLAVKSIRGTTDDIQKAMLKSLFRETLQVDPSKCISAKLQLMKKWQ